MNLHTSQNSKGERLGLRLSGDHGSAAGTPRNAGIGSELILFTNTKMRCTVNPSCPAVTSGAAGEYEKWPGGERILAPQALSRICDMSDKSDYLRTKDESLRSMIVAGTTPFFRCREPL